MTPRDRDKPLTPEQRAEADAYMEANFAPFVNPFASAERQVTAALEDLYRPADAYLRWPFDDLDELTGPLGAGGDVWFVAAFSGGGKTTFITSCIEAWRRQGKRVYCMPLETQAKRFRTYLACNALAAHEDPAERTIIDPGEVISGAAKSWPDWPALRSKLAAEYTRQMRAPYAQQVMISELSAIDVHGLNEGMAEAKGFGADVVILDHIDHVEGTAGKSAAEQSAEVNHAALEIVKQNDMLLVCTSQLNLDALRSNRDKLAKFAPPSVNQLWLPGKKLHIATGIVGLHRKIRERGPTETEDDYAKAMKAAHDGTADPQTLLDNHVMGVNAMKLRNRGRNDGRRVYLGYEHGRVVPLDEKDRYLTEFGGRPRRVA